MLILDFLDGGQVSGSDSDFSSFLGVTAIENGREVIGEEKSGQQVLKYSCETQQRHASMHGL